ncbi:cholest-4-en-3-one 26-monooxygenase [Rhodococcus rhodochrous J3]|uniref:Cytochrome P450 n=2 Tax=Rhodococcus rhodochrous TaxID=1829 RepID=A0AA47A750_RHORH|nr:MULTISPECIES: cytochrome P450 [Rhodococcus]MBF4477667.1 cytochrome P450 [Rhodococcus rhodochrous]MCD2098069.1 cytochrome P450 [Rhodococcus rhodochrous]MCD2122195.1 cytochrome P450 [Rhodococcus rhodochrous]MCQ4133864.1 cytochrome P450 [Rhodococcus rhodochrous]MCR8692427.1 cytochrome P450 [Rhodococcus pyridinivorans]
MAQPNIPEDIDFTDPDLYADRMPFEEFAELRKTAPVWWNKKSPDVGGFHDEGFWVVSRHEEVREVSRRSDVFSNWENTAIPRFNDDIPREAIELQRHVLLNKDAPEHTKLRKLVARGFTPRAINGLRDELDRRSKMIVQEACQAGQGDFVTQIAAELPLQAIADLIGVPQEDRAKIFEWSNQMTGYDDPDNTADPAAASMEVLGYAYQMAAARKENPADDIVTTLIEADIDGDELAPEEFGFFFIVLAVAGNETTRNAITHGMAAFLDNPEQWEIFKRDRPKTAADEIIRWATPVTSFQRTALEDTELGGQTIRKGERVVMLYASANNDEEVFENPREFDILRDPNPHLAFGGTGAHYCLGANLARMEIDLIFNAIADHIPDITKIGDPHRLRSGWLNGIKEFQVDYKTSGGCPVQH